MSTTADAILLSTPPAADLRPGVFDLVLRGQQRLTQLLTDEAFLPEAVQKLLAWSLVGFATHGLVTGAALQWTGGSPLAATHPALWMPFAFALSFVGALCICLPSFYFYTQLAGIDASFRLVTAQALRANATTSVLLLGVAPFYAAYALACRSGFIEGGADEIANVGYLLPFAVGLFGVRNMYRGFAELAEVLPRTHTRRGHFLRRMVVCWCGIYSLVAPVALWRLTVMCTGQSTIF